MMWLKNDAVTFMIFEMNVLMKHAHAFFLLLLFSLQVLSVTFTDDQTNQTYSLWTAQLRA